MSASIDIRTMRRAARDLTAAMAEAGFVESEPLDGGSAAWPDARSPQQMALWFVRPESGVPRMTKAVIVYLARHTDADVTAAGWARIGSAEIDEVLRDLLPDFTLYSKRSGEVENVPFGALGVLPDRLSKFPVSFLPGGAEEFVGWFMGCVRGPVMEWFGRRSSLDDLLVLAREETAHVWDVNPDPVRLRGVVVLCVLEGRVVEAAELMGWYLGREGWHRWDSVEQASGFDVLLRERFPEYDRARRAMG